MANGNEQESYAKANCYSLEDIEGKYGEKITFIIEYQIDCWGWFDEGRVTATVNGNTKTKYTTGNAEGFWTWEITCYPGEVDWTIKSWCKDDNPLFPAWEKNDECSGSLDLVVIGDVECSGSINDNSVEPNERVTGSFTVRNDGVSGSKLDWMVSDYPDWGSSWSFTPSSGEDLPSGSTKTVSVSFNAPAEKGSHTGTIKVINKDDSSNSDTVSVSITVEKSKEVDKSQFLNFLENYPNLFLLLRLFLQRLS
jgi:hypothetical protein